MSQSSQESNTSSIMSQATFDCMWNVLANGIDVSNTNGTLTTNGAPIELEFQDDVDHPADNIQFNITRYQLKSEDPFGIAAMPPAITCSSSVLGVINNTCTSSGLQQNVTTNSHYQYPEPVSTSFQVTPTIPSNSNYPGEYGLDFSFGPQSLTTAKSALWTYSEGLKKLFVRMSATCPIRFKTAKPVPQGCCLRAMPMFKQAEHVKQIVKRCPNHTCAKDKEARNEGHPAPSHLIRCENANADYHENALSGRQSVVVLFESPQVGSEWNTYLYNFMCYGSCVGGLNRRPIQLVFTLEHDNKVIARRVLEVRICACPGRDRKAEEKHLVEAENPVSRKKSYKQMSKQLTITQFKKRKRDDDTYTLEVKGRERYEMLMKINESLELMDSLNPDDITRFRESKRPNLGHSNSTSGSGSGKDGQEKQTNGQHRSSPGPVAQRDSGGSSSEALSSSPDDLLSQCNIPNGVSPGLTNGGVVTNGLTNGGLTNGLTNGGHTNGLTNGGLTNGLTNAGHTNDLTNGGLTNGLTNGGHTHLLTNGGLTSCLTNGGLSNGLTNGPVTGDHLTNGHHHRQVTTSPVEMSSHAHSPPQLRYTINNNGIGVESCTSITSWLANLGCSIATEQFINRNILHVGQLNDFRFEDLKLMNLSENLQEMIWKGVVDVQTNPAFSNIPSLLRTSSNSSQQNGNIATVNGGVFEATRFTLKQTISWLGKMDDF